MKIRVLVIFSSIVLTACAPDKNTESTATGVDTGSMESARQSLLETDRAFFRTLHPAAPFLAYLDDDVCFLPPDSSGLQGPENFRTGLEQFLQLPGAKPTWAPDVARVSTDGTLGFTIGFFELIVDGPEGNPVSRLGTYKTSWARHDDGRWLVVADMFNFDAPITTQPET